MPGQLPPECPPPPDTACPVDPNPPRDVDDEPELVEVELEPLRLATNPVETAVGARRDQYEPVFEYRPLDDEYDEYPEEYEFQRQPLHERRRQGSAFAAGAGVSAFGGLTVVDAADVGRHSGRDGIM
jgi:hypothetical protein